MSILFASPTLRSYAKHVQYKDCEPFFNAALTMQVIIQRFPK